MRGNLLSSIALVLLLGACGPGQDGAGNPPTRDDVRLTVKALEVRSGDAGARDIVGRFEIRSARNNETYVADAAAKGGACLVAQVPVDPKSCSADSECAVPGQQFFPYCLQGTCWVKPKAESCLRGQGVGVHQTTPGDANEVYAYLASISETRPVAWRVLGRLNGTPVEPQHSCTKEAGFMYDCGNPRKVP